MRWWKASTSALRVEAPDRMTTWRAPAVCTTAVKASLPRLCITPTVLDAVVGLHSHSVEVYPIAGQLTQEEASEQGDMCAGVLQGAGHSSHAGTDVAASMLVARKSDATLFSAEPLAWLCRDWKIPHNYQDSEGKNSAEGRDEKADKASGTGSQRDCGNRGGSRPRVYLVPRRANSRDPYVDASNSARRLACHRCRRSW